MNTPHTRTAGWARRWSDLVVQRLQQPFAWGSNDCATFVADAVLALHQHDTLAVLRAPRHSALQAARQLRELGGPLVLSGSRCGLEPVTAAQARVGDLVMLAQGRRFVLAVCNGADALAPGANGLLDLPMTQAVTAWRT